jgi:hypothetical protein
MLKTDAKLQHLRSLDLSAISAEDASRLINDVAKDYITAGGRAFLPTSYRVRINDGDALFSRVEELWAPPPEKTRTGRFNRRGAPVLYLSSTPIAAIWEMRPKANQRYTILACAQRKDSARLPNVVIGGHRFKPTEKTGPLADHMSDGVRSAPGFMDELRRRGILEQWILIDDFFSDIATLWCPPGEESDHYKLTIPLWEALVGLQQDVDLLLYPSVQHNLHAFNVALKLPPASAIQPLEAWVIEIRDMVNYAIPGERDFFGPITHRGDVLDDGSIRWEQGEWSLERVRAAFRAKVGAPLVFADAPPMLKYSEEEIAAESARYAPNRARFGQYRRSSARFGGYSWKP